MGEGEKNECTQENEERNDRAEDEWKESGQERRKGKEKDGRMRRRMGGGGGCTQTLRGNN